MMKQIAFLIYVVLLHNAVGASQLLRASAKDQRQLQLASLMNSVITNLKPIMEEWIHVQLENFTSIEVGEKTVVNIEEGNDICKTSVNVTYGVGTIHGFNNITLNSIELVEGSDYINTSYWGLDGAEWGGEWKFNGTFPEIKVDASTVLKASLCGIPVKETFNAVVTITQATVVGRVTMNGTTDQSFSLFSGENFITLDSVSQVSPLAKEVVLEFGSLSADFGIVGNVANVATTQSLEKQILDDFTNQMETFILKVVNKVLIEQSPLPIYDTNNL